MRGNAALTFQRMVAATEDGSFGANDLANCSNCSSTLSTETETDWLHYERVCHYPKILIYQIARFDHFMTKNGRSVFIDHEIGVSIEEQSNTSKERLMRAYYLRAVILHKGNSNSGHYTVLVQEPSSSSDSGVMWYLYNDAEIPQARGHATTPWYSIENDGDPYILFYERGN